MAADTWDKDELAELETKMDLSDQDILNLRMVDIEASSLFKLSHPIEIGVCGVDLAPEAMLIKPPPHWDDWSVASENVHRISRTMLERDGIEPRLVALRMNAIMRGKYGISDNVGFDSDWNSRLFVEADLSPLFGLQDFNGLLLSCRKIAVGFTGPKRLKKLMEKLEKVYQHTHRAGDDALQMAAAVRILVDREWADWFERQDLQKLLAAVERYQKRRK